MGIIDDFIDDYVKPLGELIIIVVFSIYTRIALCIYLAFSNPLSVEFKYLAVIIFCIPILRYVFHWVKKTNMPDGSNMYILWVFPVLYAFVIFKVLYIYQFPIMLGLLILFLPVGIYYTFVVAQKVYPNNRIRFLTSLCFYLLPFLFAVNFAFDTSKTTDKRYYVIGKKEIVSVDNSSEGIDTHNYFLDLVPADKNIEAPKWVEVSKKTSEEFRGIYSSNHVYLNNLPYRILEKKKATDTIKRSGRFLPTKTRLRYYFLLQKDMDYKRRKVDGKVYDKFNRGDYIIIEKHPGLFGIAWITYR